MQPWWAEETFFKYMKNNIYFFSRNLSIFLTFLTFFILSFHFTIQTFFRNDLFFYLCQNFAFSQNSKFLSNSDFFVKLWIYYMLQFRLFSSVFFYISFPPPAFSVLIHDSWAVSVSELWDVKHTNVRKTTIFKKNYFYYIHIFISC